MTDDVFPADRLNRILVAVETIDESLGTLARKQQLTREEYKHDPDTQDIVERRFVKMTEAAIDIGEEILQALRPVVHEHYDLEEAGAGLGELDIDGDGADDA